MIPAVLLGAALLLTGAVLVWREVHFRRRVRELLDRLEELQPPRDPTLPPTVPTDPESGGTPLDLSSVPSGDVLHGRSDLVEEVLERGPVSLEEQAIWAVYQHMREPVSPAALAEELHVSLRTLERGLARTMGCTPRQLIVAIKMREARRMLEAGTPVNAVAIRLAFSSPGHFSRRFKAFYKKSPSHYLERAGRGRPAATTGPPTARRNA